MRSTPVYRGTPWSGWNPQTVVVVQQTTVVITTFVIVNLAGPGYIDRPAGTTGDRDTPSSYTGGTAGTSGTSPSVTSTNPSTTLPPSTITPTSASTVPPSTLPPADFCAQFSALQAKWMSVSDVSPAQRQELSADFDRLAAAAPAEVSADMQLIAGFVRTLLTSESLDNIPPDVQAAEERVTAYLQNVCGITVG